MSSQSPRYVIDKLNWVASVKMHGKKIWRAVGQCRRGANMGKRKVLGRKDLRNKTAAIRYRKDFEERYDRLLRAYKLPTSGVLAPQSRAPRASARVKVGGSLTVERVSDARSES